MEEILIQISANHFCAGIIFRDSKVFAFAPILKWSKGKSYYWMKKYCEKKKWRFIEV